MNLSPLQMTFGANPNVQNTTGLYLPFKEISSIFNLKLGGVSRPEILAVSSKKKISFYSI